MAETVSSVDHWGLWLILLFACIVTIRILPHKLSTTSIYKGINNFILTQKYVQQGFILSPGPFNCYVIGILQVIYKWNFTFSQKLICKLLYAADTATVFSPLSNLDTPSVFGL